MKLKRPVIVSASMSGSFALPYLMNPEPDTCSERLRGFIPLAPVATEKFSHAAYHRCEVRPLAVQNSINKNICSLSVMIAYI